MLKMFARLFNHDKIYQASSSTFLKRQNILLYFSKPTKNQITDILNNRQLLKILEKNDIALFVCTKEIPSYVLSKNIHFIDEDFIKASKEYIQMLVTDFSPLSIDFIASDRPIIFFNTSEKISYYKEKLYNFTTTPEATANLIIHYIKKNFVLEDNFKDKNLAFIALNMAGNIETSTSVFD